MKLPTALGPLSFVFLGALTGSIVCLVDWMVGSADPFSCFPLYGAIGATILGVVGLSRAEKQRAASQDSQ